MDRQGRVLHSLLVYRSLALTLVAGTLFTSGCASGGRGAFPNFFASKEAVSGEDAELDSATRMAEAGPAGSGTKEASSAGSGTRSMTAAYRESKQIPPGAEPTVNRYTGTAVQTVASKAKASAPAAPEARPSTPASVASYSKSVPAADRARSEPALVVLQDSRDFMPLLNSSGPVLLDFYTTWCGPCKRQSKILHEMEGLAAQTGARIIKIDAEKHRDIASRFQVKVYPTLVLLKDGAVQAHNPGAIFDKDKLASWLSQ